MKKYVAGLCVAVCLSLLPVMSGFAGGIGINATRIIYPAESKSVSVTVRNNNDKVYLGQVGISASLSRDEPAPFIVTPFLFRMEPGSQNTVKIINTNKNLPADRESLFWFSLQASPSVDEAAGGVGRNITGASQISLGSIIKLIYRPKGLSVSPAKGFCMLSFSRDENGVSMKNSSPYYISFFSFKVNGQEEMRPDQSIRMVAPQSQAVMPVKGITYPAKVKWIAITDQGGEQSCQGEVRS